MGYVQYFELDMNTKIQREIVCIVKVRSGGSITIPSETSIFFLKSKNHISTNQELLVLRCVCVWC